MEKFLDTIDSYIFILNKSSDIIFCNKKLLNKLKCTNEELHKLKISITNKNNRSIKEIINNIEKDEELNENLRLYSDEKKIELNSKITSGHFYNDDIVFVSSSKAKLINYNESVENKTLEKNIREEMNGSEKSISILNDILEKAEQNIPVNEIFNEIDITQVIEQTLGEIYKSDLMRKDFKLLLDISADLVGVIDNKGYLKTTGQAWTDCLGWSKEEFLNCNILNLVHEDHKEKLISILNSDNEDVNVIENKMKCKNETYKWLRWNLKLVKEKESYVFTIRDITKEKEEEKQRKKLEEAIHLESIKNEFFTNMSHEFKTPLNIILGTMQLLDRNVNNEHIVWNKNIDLNKYIKLIKQNSYRLLRLINNLIDRARIDNGYYELKLGNYDIVNIVEDITLSVAQYIEGKGINLIFDTNCEEKIIACDPEKIERILLNLLSNSIKYTKENGSIYVNLEVKKENINISVKDNGEGISKDKLPIIFNRFVQGDSTLIRTCKGSGIGLSLVKSLVEMHNGEIHVNSKEGVGTNFDFYLPNKTIHCIEDKLSEKYISQNNDKIEMCNIEFSDIYGM